LSIWISILLIAICAVCWDVGVARKPKLTKFGDGVTLVCEVIIERGKCRAQDLVMVKETRLEMAGVDIRRCHCHHWRRGNTKCVLP